MKTFIENIEASLANAHVAWPIYLGVALEVASVVWPDHKDQLSQIQKILLSYGVIAAANSVPSTTPTNKP